MIETASADLLASGTVPLEMTQTQIFEAIQGNQLLASSLWINIALAGLSILLFVYMGRNVDDPRAQLIFVATLMVPLVSISSYTGLVSGLTVASSRCRPDTRWPAKRYSRRGEGISRGRCRRR